MSDKQDGQAAIRNKGAEITVALIFFALGAIAVIDSARIGASWGDDGPQTGYFPFYIGVILCIAAAIVVVQALLIKPVDNETFVETGQLKLVLSVLVPTAIYTALIGWLGIYLASALFVGFFMRWLGKYPWWKVAVVSVGTMVAFFLIFEVWFLVALPKGPLENLLGVG